MAFLGLRDPVPLRNQEGHPMSSLSSHPRSPSCATLLQSFLPSEGLPFAEVLTAEHCRELFHRQGRAWDPPPCAEATADGARAHTPVAADASPAAPRVPRGPVWTTTLTLWTFLQQ